MSDPVHPAPAAPDVPATPAAPAAPAAPPPSSQDPFEAMAEKLAALMDSKLSAVVAKLEAARPAPVEQPKPASKVEPEPAKPDLSGVVAKQAVLLHVGPLKQDAYLQLAPAVVPGADGLLSDADRAKLDDWKAKHPDLFKLAPPSTTPAGGPGGAPPAFTPEQAAYFQRWGIDPATIATRNHARMLLPTLGHNSSPSATAGMVS